MGTESSVPNRDFSSTITFLKTVYNAPFPKSCAFDFYPSPGLKKRRYQKGEETEMKSH